MKYRPWLVAVVVLCSVAATSIFALQSSPARPLKASGEHATFEWLFLPLGVARAQGFWSRNGLDPTFIPAAASAVQLRQHVESGIQIGLVNTAEVLLARSQGLPVKVVAGYLGESVAKIYVRADSSMRTTRDLDGRKIGILSETHTSYRAVLYLNRKLRIKAEPVALGDLERNVSALRAATVDAIYSAEGAALAMADAGVLRVLVALPDVYPRPYTATVVWATEDLIAESPSIVKAFVKTILEATKYVQEHPDYATDLYVAKTGASRTVAARSVVELNRLLTASGEGSGEDLRAAVAGNWQFTKDSGAVPAGTNVDIRQAVDVRFLP